MYNVALVFTFALTCAQLVGVVRQNLDVIVIRVPRRAWVERLGRHYTAPRQCRLDFYHMNIPRYNRELALSLCTHVFRRAAYNVVIAHARPREE